MSNNGWILVIIYLVTNHIAHYNVVENGIVISPPDIFEIELATYGHQIVPLTSRLARNVESDINKINLFSFPCIHVM